MEPKIDLQILHRYHDYQIIELNITTANTGFASGGVKCQIEALCFYSSSVLVDQPRLMLPNPTERKA